MSTQTPYDVTNNVTQSSGYTTDDVNVNTTDVFGLNVTLALFPHVHKVVWVPYLGLLFLIIVAGVLGVSFYNHRQRMRKRRQNAMDYIELDIDLNRKRLHGIMHAKVDPLEYMKDIIARNNDEYPAGGSEPLRIEPLYFSKHTLNTTCSECGVSPKRIHRNFPVRFPVYDEANEGQLPEVKVPPEQSSHANCCCHCCKEKNCVVKDSQTSQDMREGEGKENVEIYTENEFSNNFNMVAKKLRRPKRKTPPMKAIDESSTSSSNINRDGSVEETQYNYTEKSHLDESPTQDFVKSSDGIEDDSSPRSDAAKNFNNVAYAWGGSKNQNEKRYRNKMIEDTLKVPHLSDNALSETDGDIPGISGTCTPSKVTLMNSSEDKRRARPPRLGKIRGSLGYDEFIVENIDTGNVSNSEIHHSDCNGPKKAGINTKDQILDTNDLNEKDSTKRPQSSRNRRHTLSSIKKLSEMKKDSQIYNRFTSSEDNTTHSHVNHGFMDDLFDPGPAVVSTHNQLSEEYYSTASTSHNPGTQTLYKSASSLEDDLTYTNMKHPVSDHHAQKDAEISEANFDTLFMSLRHSGESFEDSRHPDLGQTLKGLNNNFSATITKPAQSDMPLQKGEPIKDSVSTAIEQQSDVIVNVKRPPVVSTDNQIGDVLNESVRRKKKKIGNTKQGRKSRRLADATKPSTSQNTKIYYLSTEGQGQRENLPERYV